MAKLIEIEFKNLLNETEYLSVIQFFQINQHSFFEQVNIYYDTLKGDLKKQKAALRVRQVNNKFILTLKQKQQFDNIEYEQEITSSQFDNLLNDFPNGIVKDELNSREIDISALTLITKFTTVRAECNYKDGIIMVDKTIFKTHTDYEIEYEVTNYEVGEKIFNSLLTTLSIPKRKTATKIARAFNPQN